MKKFSDLEKDYMRRVVGKVPVEAMAEQMNRSINSVRQYFHTNQISIKVPAWRMERFWQHITELRQQKRALR